MAVTESLPCTPGNAAECAWGKTGRALAKRLRQRTARVAVLGLGYAGLPMAVELAQAGYPVVGMDVDRERADIVNTGVSPVAHVADRDVASLVRDGRLSATTEFERLDDVDCALICVPTPLDGDGKADLSFVEAATRSVAAGLHPGMLVVLQSTCAPGTTRGVLLPILEESSRFKVGVDFFVAFAPERIDPGNRQYTVRNTPKLVGGITAADGDLGALLFGSWIESVVVVSTPEVAELAKLVENTFRFINISFANEMAMLCDRLGVSIWEVIDAASTKPFAFMPHYPGPGVGGHCIPVVPFFLTEAARDQGMIARLIEAAGQVNAQMPAFVVEKVERLLAERGKGLAGARVLLIGIAYKANVDDARGSPALCVLELLVERGARVEYLDPHVPSVECRGTTMASLSESNLGDERFDGAVLLTNHQGVDYARIAERVGFVLDTRKCLPAIPGTTIVAL